MPRAERGSGSGGRGRGWSRGRGSWRRGGAPRPAAPTPTPTASVGLVPTIPIATTSTTASTTNALLPIELYSFINESWRPYLPSSSSDPSSTRTTVRLLTYNTFSCSPSHSPHQTHSLIKQILSFTISADIIALQECSLAFVSSLKNDRRVRDGYLVSSAEAFLQAVGEGDGAWGKEGERESVLFMVRKSLVGEGGKVEVGVGRLEEGRGEGGKGVLVLRVWKEGREWLRIATSHFSSLPINALLRQHQYNAALALLFSDSSSYVKHILMGDFNNSTQEEISFLATRSTPLTDCFEFVSPPTPLPPPPPTNSSGNPYRPHSAKLHSTLSSLSASSFSEDHYFRHRPTFGSLYPFVAGAPRSKPRKGRRIDRVYYTKGEGIECVGYEEMGEGKVRDEKGYRVRGEGREGWMWASDHLGVAVTLKLS